MSKHLILPRQVEFSNGSSGTADGPQNTATSEQRSVIFHELIIRQWGNDSAPAAVDMSHRCRFWGTPHYQNPKLVHLM